MSIIGYQKVAENTFSQKTIVEAIMSSVHNNAIRAFVSVCLILMLASCNDQQVSNIEKKYQDSIAVLKNQLEQANAQINILRYPADQRLNKIKALIESDNLDDALTEIQQLKKVFPNSVEATASESLENRIRELKEAKRIEEERIKALGYKAIPEHNTVKIDYNTITLSGINVGNRFIFDAYDDSWFYRDADRGCKYVTMQMSVTSSSHDPNLPQLAAYSINGDKMNLIGEFDTEFARWRDYGAYLGNYHDSSNDFSKVSIVKFKLGLQVSNERLSKPYAIVVMKKNALTSHYDRLSNPPKSYIGSANYPSTLSLESFQSKYVLIKRFNLK